MQYNHIGEGVNTGMEIIYNYADKNYLVKIETGGNIKEMSFDKLDISESDQQCKNKLKSKNKIKYIMWAWSIILVTVLFISMGISYVCYVEGYELSSFVYFLAPLTLIGVGGLMVLLIMFFFLTKGKEYSIHLDKKYILSKEDYENFLEFVENVEATEEVKPINEYDVLV